MSKFLIPAIALFILAGCDNHNDNDTPNNDETAPSLSNTDLSGTWRYTQKQDYYHKVTSEYLHTEFFETTIVISESTDTIFYSNCDDYGRTSVPAIKSEQYFYMDSGNTPFKVNEFGALVHLDETIVEHDWLPNKYYIQSLILDKLSDDVIIDKGLFIMSGPINARETGHVCLNLNYSNFFPERGVELVVPFDNEALYFKLNLQSKPEVGSFSYTKYDEQAAILNIDIISNADLFRDTVGSNTLNFNEAQITITESTDANLAGSISFIDSNNENYNIEFQAALNH